MSDTMDSVFNILEPHGNLDEHTISALRSMFGERLTSEIGAMAPKDLAPEIISRREEHNLTNTIPAGVIAKELLDFMRAMEFSAAAPQQEMPTMIKLVQDKHPRDMSLRELLEALVERPSRYDELLHYMDMLPEIQEAEFRSLNWAVTVTGDKKKLDIGATLTRVANLGKHTIVQDKLPDGRYPTLLARVFGQEQRPMLNPFADSVDEAAVLGPIFRDFDLGNLTEETHLAYIWAKFVVGHRAWPGTIDNYDHLPQAFAAELSGRWQEIVEAYRAAKENHDPSVDGLTRYLSTQDLRSRRPFVSNTKQRDESWYKDQLEQRAGRGISQENSSVNLGRKIVRSVRTTNSSITLNDTIVLGSVSTTNSRIKGHFYVPRGAHVGTTNSKMTDEIFEMSYEGLYNKAIELGIISE